MKDIIKNVVAPASNASTSVWGWVAIISATLALSPELIDFIDSEEIKEWIVGISKIIAIIAGGGFVSTVKNKNVTGGSVAATQEAQVRVHETSQRQKIEIK